MPQVIYRGIRPKPRKIGVPEVICGESRPSPRRSRGGRSSQMAGNGTCATFWMGIDYVPICPSHSGSDWLRTNYMCTSRRAGSLRAGPGRERSYGEKGWWRPSPDSYPDCAPFSGETGRNGGLWQRPRDSEKEARLGCGTRSAHMFYLPPEGALFRLSDWHIVRFSPARPDRGRNGRSQGPIALARSATNGRNLARSCSNGIAPARTPPIGFPIGGNRGNLATTPLNGLAKWQHPASQCETGCE